MKNLLAIKSYEKKLMNHNSLNYNTDESPKVSMSGLYKTRVREIAPAHETETYLFYNLLTAFTCAVLPAMPSKYPEQTGNCGYLYSDPR
jgi:hypothetical protein